VGMLIVFFIWGGSVLTAFKALTRPQHGAYHLLCGVALAMIPVVGQFAYLIGFETPPAVPSGQRAKISEVILGAGSIRTGDGGEYVGDRQDSTQGLCPEGIPTAGRVLVKILNVGVLILLIAAALGGNVCLLFCL
jgi:hypothetical protein